MTTAVEAKMGCWSARVYFCRHERHHHLPLAPSRALRAEYLKDSNATRAYLRAGYSPRGVQPSASRLLRRPEIAAAVAAGRQRVTEMLALSVERLAQEYAKIAFARVDTDGRVRVDLEKANEAQRAGIVELKLTNNSKGEQRVTLKLGKLQALAALTKNVGLLVAKPAPAGLTAEDRERYEERFGSQERGLNHSIREHGAGRRSLRSGGTAGATGVCVPSSATRL